jgi:hypothetical protein
MIINRNTPAGTDLIYAGPSLSFDNFHAEAPFNTSRGPDELPSGTPVTVICMGYIPGNGRLIDHLWVKKASDICPHAPDHPDYIEVYEAAWKIPVDRLEGPNQTRTHL